jgi:DNA-binding transcriptional MocR family regulator
VLAHTYISGTTSVNIAASIESAISAGRAAAGEALPPVRAVATARGVSTATVAAAYRLLRDRGLVVADGRRGTRIRGAAVREVAGAPFPSGVRDLAGGNPDPALLPSLEKAVSRIDLSPRLYGGEINHPDLLELAATQFAGDGLNGPVSVVSGALDGIERVLREHLRPGDRVVVEDPCFTGISDILAALALIPVPVEVDDEGPIPHSLRTALGRRAAAFIVTPRAQNPTGAAVSERRQRTLRSILRLRPEVLIVEDDHAGPIAGAPYLTLIDSSRPAWAVVRSVSKSLGPDLRLAVMASDETTAGRIERGQTSGIRWVSHLLQQTVVALWRDRNVARVLKTAEKTYAERRDGLIEALTGHGIEAHGRSGLNVWIPVPEEAAVLQALMRLGWGVQAGERYRLGSGPAIRVTTAGLEQAGGVRFAQDLASILRPARRSSSS